MRDIYNYRGDPGMLAWALHRLSGLGIVLFLALHIVDIFLVGAGKTLFNDLLFIYRHPISRVLEIFLLFGLLYHALNGLRIIILDFWPWTSRIHVQLWYAQLVIFLVVFLPLAAMMLMTIGQG